MWFKADRLTSLDARLISRGLGTTTFWTVGTVGPRLRFRIRFDNVVTTIDAGTTVTAGTWTHVAAVYDGARLSLYQDGQLVRSAGRIGTPLNSASARILLGNDPGQTHPFEGMIDEVRLYSKALNEDEIQREMALPINRYPLCGNAVVDAGEECDDGNSIDDDSCGNDCASNRCGDGEIIAPEECDDGNAIDDDACGVDCRLNFCGDGQITGEEECDDGNSIDDDACGDDCRLNF